jgi:hypothetical protein
MAGQKPLVTWGFPIDSRQCGTLSGRDRRNGYVPNQKNTVSLLLSIRMCVCLKPRLSEQQYMTSRCLFLRHQIAAPQLTEDSHTPNSLG